MISEGFPVKPQKSWQMIHQAGKENNYETNVVLKIIVNCFYAVDFDFVTISNLNLQGLYKSSQISTPFDLHHDL